MITLGRRGSFRALYPPVNILTDPIKPNIDICIRVAHNLQSQCIQIFCSFLIIFSPLAFVVLRAIQLYDKFCAGTVKVHNIRANNSLFVNFHRIFTQK